MRRGQVIRRFADAAIETAKTTVLDVDLSCLGVAAVQATVLCNHAAVEDNAYLQRELDGASEINSACFVAVPVPEHDVVTVLAGRYRARLHGIPQALSAEIVDLPPESRSDLTFHVPLGNVVIRLTDAARRPARGVRIGIVCGGLFTGEDVVGATDGDGTLRRMVGAGTFEVVALPPVAWSPTCGGRPLARVPILADMEPRTVLGTVTVRPNETTEATFVAPATGR